MNTIDKHKINLERISDMRIIDDDFMSIALNDEKCAEEIIKIILDMSDISVVEINTQVFAPNIYGHDSRFDVVVTDRSGKVYNVEVQRAISGASPKRARFYSSILDTCILNKGEDYNHLRETYCIFIVEGDMFKKNKELYTIGRYVEQTGDRFKDEHHIVYFNLDTNGDSERAKLARDFYCRNPAQIENPVLRKRVSFLKNTEEGKHYMGEIMMSIREEGKEEGFLEGRKEGRKEGLKEGLIESAKQMLADNLPLEVIARYSTLPLQKVQELAEGM